MLTVRKAVQANAKPLIGLYAESNGGKTHSALILAKGFTGDMNKVHMIETESGRGEAWAEDAVVGGYNVISLHGNFSPNEYGQAISLAEKSNAQCLIVDSGSHEWEGVNGVLAMAAQNQADGKKGPIVWQQPKILHQREFMLRLTQSPIPLIILCMRAKYVMEEVTPDYLRKLKEKHPDVRPPKLGEWTRSADLSPKQSEDVLFEMFVHGWLDKEKHCFHGTKYTVQNLREVIRDGEPITVETGQRLAAWAAARKSNAAPELPAADSPRTAGQSAQQPGAAAHFAPTGDLDALLVKGREWAECGTDRYADWWGKTLTKEQRKMIGEAQHSKWKELAHKST